MTSRRMGRHWAVPRNGSYAEYIDAHFVPGYLGIAGVHDRLDALDGAGLIHHPTRGRWPGLKRYAEADQGNLPQSLILNPRGFTNFNVRNGEYTGYATQKPVALYEQFIRASSKPGDTVLDIFAGVRYHCRGCRTSGQAVDRVRYGVSQLDDAQNAGSTSRDSPLRERLMRPSTHWQGLVRAEHCSALNSSRLRR